MFEALLVILSLFFGGFVTLMLWFAYIGIYCTKQRIEYSKLLFERGMELRKIQLKKMRMRYYYATPVGKLRRE